MKEQKAEFRYQIWSPNTWNYIPIDIISRFRANKYLFVNRGNHQKIANFGSLDDLFRFLEDIATQTPQLVEQLDGFNIKTVVSVVKNDDHLFTFLVKNQKDIINNTGIKIDNLLKKVEDIASKLSKDINKHPGSAFYPDIVIKFVEYMKNVLKPSTAGQSNDPSSPPVAGKQ